MNTRSTVTMQLPAIPRFLPAVGVLAGYLFTPLLALEQWRRKQQASEQLAHVDPRILRDAGISDAQRFIEVNKPS